MMGTGQRLKFITTLHGTDITLVGQEASFHAITKFSIERSDAVTAVSAYLRDETIRAFGCEQCRISVIPNFVNLQEYRPRDEVRRDGLAPLDHKLVTHISNFREVKRVKDVVRVFSRIRRAMPATLLMIGDGPERDDAEREARELEVAGDVRFLGRLDSVAELLQQSDLFVLPTQSESFGLAALEAMACGVPVWGAGPAGCPRWSRMGSAASWSRPARWRRWAAARSSCSAIRPGMARWWMPQSPAPGCSTPTGSCRCTNRSTGK